MESASIRSKLHEYIDIADVSKLEAIYAIMESDIEVTGNFTASDLAFLHERRTRRLDGSSKSYTISESLGQIRNRQK